MADDDKKPKRMTAEEARKAQQERERQEFEDQQAKQKAHQDAANAARDQKHAALAKRITDGWYDVAVATSKRGGATFVVLADLGLGQTWKLDPHIKGIIAAIEADGWKALVADLDKPQGLHAHALATTQQEPHEGEVACGGMRGWRPAGVPRFGEHFAHGYTSVLIVKWAP